MTVKPEHIIVNLKYVTWYMHIIELRDDVRCEWTYVSHCTALGSNCHSGLDGGYYIQSCVRELALASGGNVLAQQIHIRLRLISSYEYPSM